ncbi:TRAP transporter large permease [Altererythrobacter ishigakiensis]|uniref:TRAP transporter large permease protein n=1 Tax=Altererythrobacter ishigakiensis TaxID=476157 RepID=A0A562UM39_9SPHN|nr:TRAP transporter large permease [Altererythrobacter ishigakiensis]TWJ06675.1 tripartite ATP-independent transporter DctM subunit [Altererythrobacter ishigakiensis]
MTTGLILVLVFFILVALNVPIGFAIGLSTLAALLAIMPIDPATTTMAQRMVAGLDSFTLLAIPFFILSGYLMGAGGVARRLIDAAKGLIGALPGGLAVVSIISSMLFGSVSGSAVAATSAIGSFMVPAMKKEGYDAPFAASVTTSASILGLLIPPSNVMIVYAVAAGGVSIGALFLAGYGPGLLAGLALIIAAMLVARRAGYPVSERLSLSESLRTIVPAIPSIAMLVIVVGGIVSGFFTATEASAFAVVYSLLLGIYLHREMRWKDLPGVIIKSAETTGIVLFLIAASTGMAWMLAYSGMPGAIAEALLTISDNPLLLLLLINVVLLIVGAFLDITPAILIFTPIFLPVAVALGISPVHFGMILIFNLSIGLCTPPVGTVLFVGAAVGETKVAAMIKPMTPLYLAMIAALAVTTAVPALSEALPRFFGMM